jgi:hypothetical protein
MVEPVELVAADAAADNFIAVTCVPKFAGTMLAPYEPTANDTTWLAAADIALDSITLAAVGATVNAVTAVEVDPVKADTASSPLEDMTAAFVGAALKAVIAADADDVKAEAASKPADDIAPRVAEVTAVTKPKL